MSQERLGFDFNYVDNAAGTASWINMTQAAGITYFVNGGTGSTTTATFQGGKTLVGATPVTLAVITRNYNTVAASGTAPWTLSTQAAGSTFTVAANNVGSVHIQANDLPDGYYYVNCQLSGGSANAAHAVLDGLEVKRDPKNLPAPSS